MSRQGGHDGTVLVQEEEGHEPGMSVWFCGFEVSGVNVGSTSTQYSLAVIGGYIFFALSPVADSALDLEKWKHYKIYRMRIICYLEL